MPFLVPVALLAGATLADPVSPAMPAVPWLMALIIFTGTLTVRLRALAAAARPAILLAILGVIHVVMPLLALFVARVVFADRPELGNGMVLEFLVPVASAGFTWVVISRGSVPARTARRRC